MLRVGCGVGQKCFSEMVTDQTSGMGIQSTRNKFLTKQRLRQANLPVAPGIEAHSYETALAATLRLGFPVVTKPVDRDQGVGVVTGIANDTALRRAWNISVNESPKVLIERHVAGRDFRFLVVMGKLIAALERIPGGITGDGILSVRDLVLIENQKRNKHQVLVEGGVGHVSLVPIEINQDAEEMLQKHGLDLDSIPNHGQFVPLRYGANFSLGGTVRECLLEVAPENRFLIEKTARTFKLDIVGVDVIAPSIDRPLFLTDGVICEVNSMPGVLPHMVAEPERKLMDELAQIMLECRISVPLVGILGLNSGAIIRAVEIAVLPKVSTLMVSDRSGLRQGGLVLSERDGCSFSLQRQAIQDHSAAAVLLELEITELMMQGLAWPRLSLLVIEETVPNKIPEPYRQWLFKCASQVIEISAHSPETSRKATAAAIQCLSAAQ